MKLRVYSRQSSVEAPLSAWEALAQNALVTNPFYEHWNLLPALQYLEPEESVELITGWRDNELVALLPVHYKTRMPFFVLALHWKHDECYNTAPLVTDLETWAEFLTLLLREQGIHMLVNSTQPEVDLAPESCLNISRLSYQRAALDCTQSQERIEEDWPKKRRKDWRRLLRRAFEAENAHYQNARSPSECRAFFSEYQRIEATGWKGDAGSAIALNNRTLKYYESVVAEGSARGQVQIQKLEIKGKAIAVSLRLCSRGQAFEVKTSYCEQHRQLAPGVLLEILNMRDLANSEISRADSCTQAGNRLVETLWNSALTIHNNIYFSQSVFARLAWLASNAYQWIKHHPNACAAKPKKSKSTSLALD